MCRPIAPLYILNEKKISHCSIQNSATNYVMKYLCGKEMFLSILRSVEIK